MHACITFFDWTACMHAWAPMFLILSCTCSYTTFLCSSFSLSSCMVRHHTCPLACMFGVLFFFFSRCRWYGTTHVHLHVCLQLILFFLYVQACSFFFSAPTCWHLQSLLSSLLLLFSFGSSLLFIFLPTFIFNFVYNNFIGNFCST